ncbi:immunoglobulin superfamily member 2 [Trichosurus vulpecula]|uniref:immunoglobulin superfamily member 2 n=1 Tax=Trichosurus vulpecula TaxID=9337 RepID=UPI00186B4308|nr:immunoglobulin superfamily member 2 [Trichosurus vulpecula]
MLPEDSSRALAFQVCVSLNGKRSHVHGTREKATSLPLPMGSVPLVTTYVLLFLTELSTGQRRVTVQKGPLYRAEGYPVSIACNVTGHQGLAEQTFQWSIYKPDKPDREVQIISTKDPDFTYAFYTLRVQRRDIYVERIQGNSVLLHISKLQTQDAGEYECHTLNTDGKYFGSYSDKVILTVIPDTLSVTMSPQTLNREEGESLTLTCEVSKATTQHTHLSVSWYQLQERGNQATEIISLSKDFILIPGSSYTERFSAGDVRLDKIGNTAFRLSIGRLQPVDQGQLFCEAIEWIQDPDETWTFITRKQTDKATLIVQPEVKDFQVDISVESSFAVGQPLRLICSVASKSSQNQRLQVVWFLNATDIGNIDASGVLGLKKDYEERANLGQLQVSKISPKAFTFTISSMGPRDEGTYRCEVAEVVSAHEDFPGLPQRKQFADITVRLRKPRAKTLELSAENGKRSIWEGEALIFCCKLNGAEHPLSVIWWHTPVNLQQPEFLGSLEKDGTVHLGPSYKDRSNDGSIGLKKENVATFRLEIFNTLMTDGGTYECKVTEFQNKDGGSSWTQKTPVTVNSLNSGLHVTLQSRQPKVTISDTFALSCIIRFDYSGLKVPITVTWQFQPRGALDYQQLVTITQNGTIEWGHFQEQMQKKIKVSQSSSGSQLLIYDATEEDTGIYQCKVEAYQRETQYTYGPTRRAAMVISHPVGIDITLPESQLMVKSDSQVQEISINTEADIECSILSQTKGKTQISVTWYYLPPSREASWLKILETDQDDVVKYGDDFHSPKKKQKLHSEKVSKDLFQLHIQNVDNSDQGTYHCTVEEWLWSTSGSWHKLGEKESGKTELKLKPIGSKLKVMKTNHTENTLEHRDVTINCSLESPSPSASIFSVVWFRMQEHSTVTVLVEMQHDGVLKYGKEEHRGKLHCYRSSAGDFVLKLRSVEMVDNGIYWCKVEEWQLHGSPSKWVSQASDESGHMLLRVLHSEPTFSSRICSSSFLLYFLVIYPFVIFIPLLIFTCCLHRKAKKMSLQSSKERQGEALWVGLKRAEGNFLNYNDCKSDEKLEEEEDEIN